MIRRLLIAAAFAALAGAAHAGDAVTLRADPTASAAAVTLGDLFEGAGRAAGVPVAPAPRPGLSTVLDAGRVQVAARNAGLDWDNAQGLRRVIVRSGSAPAAPALAATGAPERAAPASAREVLVYARNINTGDVVQAEDLTWGRAVAGADAPSDPDAVIGMAARRPLRSGAAVASRDVSAPQVIRREDLVTVTYSTGGVSLSLQAKASQHAAVGETFRLVNLQSRRMIEAVATGPGQAVVGPQAERLRAASLTDSSLARSLMAAR